MSQQDRILRTGFALFSALTSFIFVFYAVSTMAGEGTSEWLKMFAYVVGGYGLLNIYILSWAWRSGSGWTPSANLLIAACFIGVVIMDFLRDGMKTGLQIPAILGLAAVLGINWFTVKKLSQQNQPEKQKKPRKGR